MPESPKRACDACHRRKVKCVADGSPKCRNCLQSNLQCTYNAVPQKKGPKGCRAKVISELRETQRQTSSLSSYRTNDSSSNPPSPGSARASSLSPELINICVEYFFSNVYPTQPILDRERLEHTIALIDSSLEDYCLVFALCGYMLIQCVPGIIIDGEELDRDASVALGTTLLAEAFEARKGCNYVENPTLTSITTSFFFFGSYFNLESQNTAYFHLREATTLCLLLGLHQEENYGIGDIVELRLRRRLYWLIFVTERAYALQTQRPLTLYSTINLPDINENPREAVELTGFHHLIYLFKPFDDTFVGLWNQSLEGCTVSWITSLHEQLTSALPKYLRSTETQAVDLRTSQQWLRIMIWQLSISNRLLSSTAPNESMTFRYPIELARELAAEASQFSQRAMDVHGIGLIKKLFDVACTLVDVMTCVPIDEARFEVGPRDLLHHFLHVLSRHRGGQDRYLPLLLSKANDTLPRGANGFVPRSLPSSSYGHFNESPNDALMSTNNASASRSDRTDLESLNIKSGFVDMVGSSHFSGLSTSSPFDGSTVANDPFIAPEHTFQG